MVYLLKIVIIHGELLNNQMVCRNFLLCFFVGLTQQNISKYGGAVFRVPFQPDDDWMKQCPGEVLQKSWGIAMPPGSPRADTGWWSPVHRGYDNYKDISKLSNPETIVVSQIMCFKWNHSLEISIMANNKKKVILLKFFLSTIQARLPWFRRRSRNSTKISPATPTLGGTVRVGGRHTADRRSFTWHSKCILYAFTIGKTKHLFWDFSDIIYIYILSDCGQ